MNVLKNFKCLPQQLLVNIQCQEPSLPANRTYISGGIEKSENSIRKKYSLLYLSVSVWKVRFSGIKYIFCHAVTAHHITAKRKMKMKLKENHLHIYFRNDLYIEKYIYVIQCIFWNRYIYIDKNVFKKLTFNLLWCLWMCVCVCEQKNGEIIQINKKRKKSDIHVKIYFCFFCKINIRRQWS